MSVLMKDGFAYGAGAAPFGACRFTILVFAATPHTGAFYEGFEDMQHARRVYLRRILCFDRRAPCRAELPS